VITWPVPASIHLDTSVIIGAMFLGTPDSSACSSFCRVLADGGTVVYFSQVVRLDLARALRRLATKPDKLRMNTRDEYQLDQWGSNPLVRQRWLTRGVRRFQAFLDQFVEVVEVPLTTHVWLQSIDLMAFEALDGSDALHLASARAIGVGDFATTDEDFRRITYPTVHLLRNVEPH
jgi:predicted nucleic acid-binding protein